MKGKALALGVAVAGAGVLSIAGYAYQEAARDWWYLRKLESPRERERREALEKLVARASPRAAQGVIEAIRKNEGEDIGYQRIEVAAPGLGPGSRAGRKFILVRAATPLCFALWRMGEPVLPCLRKALERERGDTPESRRVERILRGILTRRMEPFVELKRGARLLRIDP